MQSVDRTGLPLQALLDAHADVNVRNSSGETALHFAVMDGEREIVQLLLDRCGRVGGVTRFAVMPGLAAS